MKINYDRVADAIYLKVKNGIVNKTIKMQDRLIVDVDKKGDVIGIEILDASSASSIKKLEESVRDGIPVSITSRTPVLA